MDLTVRQGKAPAQPLRRRPHPLPAPHPGGWGQTPRAQAKSPYLGPAAHSLPACRLMGVLWPGPNSTTASGKAVLGEKPSPPRCPPGPHAYLIMSIIPVLSLERSLSS